MIGRTHLPHQVRAQKESIIARISRGLELHLASATQLLHSRTSRGGAITNAEKGLLITPWKMML